MTGLKQMDRMFDRFFESKWDEFPALGEWAPSMDISETKEKEEERTYGSFTRSVRLPVAVDASKVTASFKNGLLTVTLPKTPVARGTMIPTDAHEYEAFISLIGAEGWPEGGSTCTSTS